MNPDTGQSLRHSWVNASNHGFQVVLMFACRTRCILVYCHDVLLLRSSSTRSCLFRERSAFSRSVHGTIYTLETHEMLLECLGWSSSRITYTGMSSTACWMAANSSGFASTQFLELHWGLCYFSHLLQHGHTCQCTSIPWVYNDDRTRAVKAITLT